MYTGLAVAMKRRRFRKSIEDSLLSVGFVKAGEVLRLEGEEISTLVGFGKGFGNQWFVNVGFWIHALGSQCPEKIEKSHMYFRIERIFPNLREIILTSGDLSDKHQPDALDRLVSHIHGDIGVKLRELTSEGGLRRAMEAGALTTAGLIRKEAINYFEARWQESRLGN
ncbi:hypothetical protein [Aminobacter sp. BE322]|uniref:hypothetical protein n=1 Tax=unclassified Aminobacter TaxID=2644704 RepID=UPI003D1C1374